MLKYYEINGKTCFTDHMDFQCPPEADWKEIPEPRSLILKIVYSFIFPTKICCYILKFSFMIQIIDHAS